MNKVSWPNFSKGEREGDIELQRNLFSQKGFCMYLMQNKHKILQSQYHAMVPLLWQYSRRVVWVLFPGVPERKAGSRLSEQTPPPLLGRSHRDRCSKKLRDNYGLHLSWESQEVQNRMENLWHFSFLPYGENHLCGVTKWLLTQNHNAY